MSATQEILDELEDTRIERRRSQWILAGSVVLTGTLLAYGLLAMSVVIANARVIDLSALGFGSAISIILSAFAAAWVADSWHKYTEADAALRIAGRKHRDSLPKDGT